MAEFTTQQVGTGNWSRTSDNADSPWYDNGTQSAAAKAPGDGDTAVLAHNITVDVNTTIGSNPDDITTAVLTLGNAKTITIAEDVTLTVKGNVSKYGTLTLSLGSSFLFDKGSTSQSYTFIGANVLALRINGTALKRCTFGAVSGSRTGNFAVGWATAGVGFSVSYCDCVRLGLTSGSGPTFYASYTSGQGNFDNCTFTECRTIVVSATTPAPWSFTNNTVTGYSLDNNFSIALGGDTTSSKVCTGNVFTGLGALNFGTAGGITFSDNYVRNAVWGTGSFTTWENNFIWGEGSGSGHTVIHHKCIDTYIMCDALTNSENLSVRSAYNAVTISGSIFHHDNPDTGNSDDITIAAVCSPTNLITVENNIFLPDPRGQGPGTNHQYTDASDNGRSVYNHNTICVSDTGESGVCLGYNNVMNTLKMESLQSNLFWTSPGVDGGFKAWRTAASAVQDLVNPAYVDYNWGWGIGEGTEGNGFNSLNSTNDMFTVLTSTLDSHGGTLVADPFYDRTRCLPLYDNAAWGLDNADGTAWADDHAYSIGDVVSAATAGIYGGATINFRCITDHTSDIEDADLGQPCSEVATGWRTNWEYQSCYRLREDTSRIALMITAVKEGFKITPAELYLAGHDGATIGAMDAFSIPLTIDDSNHTHTSDNVDLTGVVVVDLVIQDSLHTHTSDVPTLTPITPTITIPTTTTTRYDVGNLVRVTGYWSDPLNSDTLIDPTVVSCSVRDPSGTVTTYVYGTDAEVVKDSTGTYYLDISVDESGVWYYRWFSSGTGQAAAEKKIVVRTLMTV